MANKEEVAEAMYGMVKEYHGKKNLKALDLIKAMIEKFGEECDKALCKQAIRQLIDSGRCTYSYVGGSYIVLPPEEVEKLRREGPRGGLSDRGAYTLAKRHSEIGR